MINTISLCSSQTTNGEGLPQTIQGSTKYALYVQGNLGGGSVKLQVSLDGTNWMDVPGSTMTAPGLVILEMIAKHIRAVLSGATAPEVTVTLASA
jgi:hypothetical protein